MFSYFDYVLSMPIRPMTKEDKTNLLALDAKIFAGKALWESTDFDLFFTEGYSFIFDDPETRRLLGYIVVNKVIKDWFLIANLGVDEAFRKQGIGISLMKSAIDNINRLVTNDNWSIGLEVESTNEPAKRLYEKLGFKLTQAGSSQVMNLTKKMFLETQHVLQGINEQARVFDNPLLVTKKMDSADKLRDVDNSLLRQSPEIQVESSFLLMKRQCNVPQLASASASEVTPHLKDVPIEASFISSRERLERGILLLKQMNHSGDKLEKFICLARQLNQSTTTLDEEREKISEHVKQVRVYLMSPTIEASEILTKQANQAKGSPSAIFQALGYFMAAIAVVAACFQVYPLVGVAAGLSMFGFYTGRRKGISAEMISVKTEQLNKRIIFVDDLQPVDRLPEDDLSPHLLSPRTLATLKFA